MADQNTDEVIVENDAPAEESEEAKPADKEEEVVPVRKSVINAQRRIIEKQAKQLDKTSKDDESDDSELTPKARKLIEDEVEKRVAPFKDELAFRDYFSEHPEDKKFEKQARARFDAWGNVPIEEVMKTLRAPVSTEEKSKAEDKAARGSMKGGTARARETTTATTEADFTKVYENVKRGKTGEAVKMLGVTQ